MTEHLSEEEQIEQLKRWWKENGKSTVTGVLLAVAAYFGYEGWQSQQQQKAEAASAIYQNMLEAVPTPVMSDEQKATASHLAGELKGSHGGSLYANYGALMLARIAVQNSDLESAATELRWALDNTEKGAVSDLIAARLARVLAELGEYDEAHKLVATTTNNSAAATFAEIRGDVYAQQNNFAGARSAYEQALEKLQTFEESRKALLDIKLQTVPADDVATVDVVAESETVAATVSTTEETAATTAEQ
ncbi:MAG: tetratricopeptide repeat protein [Cellvibrionaceae bacterium]